VWRPTTEDVVDADAGRFRRLGEIRRRAASSMVTGERVSS
jgi:hypothetical protein